jgi:hypothetical protein
MDLGAAVETLPPLLTGVARRQELKASLSKFMIGMRRQASVDPLAGGEYSSSLHSLPAGITADNKNLPQGALQTRTDFGIRVMAALARRRVKRTVMRSR